MKLNNAVTPAEVGAQSKFWIPAFAGMTIIFAAFAMTGCHRKAAEEAQVSPQLIEKGDGHSLLVFSPEDYSVLESTTVRKVELPGVLEQTGPVTFDDRL